MARQLAQSAHRGGLYQTMKKLTIHKLTAEDIAREGITDVTPGWFVHDPNNEPSPWAGTYNTKADANECRIGLTKFWKRLDNPGEDDMLDEEEQDDDSF